MDVVSLESIQAAVNVVSQLLPDGLDNLVSNAGVSYNGLKTFDKMFASESHQLPALLLVGV
jgi:NAD(P)-dependent dehydrogenase (short-subunit alcohol dehydrogenase family)